MEHNELWQHVLSEVELNVSKASFNTWFQHTGIQSKEDGVVFISVPNSFAKEWLENKFNKFILKSLRSASSDIKDLRFVITATPPSPTPQKLKKKKEDEEKEIVLDNQFEFAGVDAETNLNSKYTFEEFVVGSSNELAHAAAISVTKNLGTIYNPLFIY